MTRTRPVVSLFGGSFNPPHVVHGMVCLYLLHTGADEVWLIPTWRHAFAKELAPFEDRMAMARQLVAPLGARARVLDIEAHRDGPSYTVDTVRQLRAAHPDLDFEWVVGSDILDEIHRWKEADLLRTLVRFRVVFRGGHRPGMEGPVFPEVSSTEIREALRRGEGHRGLLPWAVWEHIHTRGLYGVDRGPDSGREPA